MILNSPYISGSSTITGNLLVLGNITGSTNSAISASYANNATSASYALNATTSSYAANADLLDGRDSLTFANTGSNSFVGSQNINGSVAITGSLTTTGAITAQTLNVQQVTSSIVYSSGSNIFGNSISNTQSMTGSVGISGSLAVVGTGTFSGNVSLGASYLYMPTAFSGTEVAGSIYKRASDGLVLFSAVGTTNDFTLYNSAGSTVMTVTTGTVNTRLYGALSGSSATFTGTLIQQNITDGTNLIGINTSNSVRQFNLFSTTTYSSLGTVTNNPLYLGTNDTVRLTIAATTGNVGIGTNSPLNVFQIGTTFPITFNSNYPQIHFNSYYDGGYRVVSAGYGSHMYLDGSTGKLIYQTGPSSVSAGGLYSPTTKFVIDTDGNVGIGTTSPRGLFQLYGFEVAAYKTYTGQGNTGGGDTIINAYRLDAASLYLRVTDIVALGDDVNNRGSTIRLMTTSTSDGTTTPALTLAPTGAATFSSTVKASGFNSLTGTNSVANTTWTAIYLIPDTQAAEGVYYAYAHYNDASDGMAYLQVLADRTYARSINGSNSTVQVRLSGKYIEVYQSYGATVDIQWSILIQKLR